MSRILACLGAGICDPGPSLFMMLQLAERLGDGIFIDCGRKMLFLSPWILGAAGGLYLTHRWGLLASPPKVPDQLPAAQNRDTSGNDSISAELLAGKTAEQIALSKGGPSSAVIAELRQELTRLPFIRSERKQGSPSGLCDLCSSQLRPQDTRLVEVTWRKKLDSKRGFGVKHINYQVVPNAQKVSRSPFEK